ncbi:MAG TPA: TRC40/GET3/ArsA family transport-energizing ATPase [Syntrophorhabdaceae bacterium]|nr:TRC40/GET3/ArsA family transport-energizing ATPase [Syntrophorhabdaceae bacterium]HNT68491.1 TRC40/GET3/ArsA family transport-energizing ATPase [Syntrophorhabdaceae bacterium]
MNQITTSMTKYMSDHPKLKYIFFGGKGGVGKTVMAGTAALWSAKQGKRTLLASTNPVHSLSNLFEKDVFGKAAVVCDDDRCFAFEIDTKDTIERSKQEIREKINWFLRFADLTTKADDFVESATMNPAFEESAMFENMTDIMFRDEYDFYVFDTAPTANARRLLGMSKVYSLWVEKMLKSREEAKSLREMLSFSKKNEADPLMDYLLSFKDRMAKAQSLLTNDQLTAFFFATLPESLPIAVITRFINWFYEFGIPVGGVVVNGLIQQDQVANDSPEFVLNRVKMQNEHMEEIWQIFGDKVRAVIPLFETEVKGAKMVNRMVDYLFKT